MTAAVNQAAVSGQNIDWAQLAQQWIQMRDNATTTNVKETPTPNVNVTKYEEKGEADMDMDDEEQVDDKDNDDKNRRDSTTALMLHSANAADAQHWFMDKTAVDTDMEVGANSQRPNQWSKWSNKQNMPKTSCQSNMIKRQINPTAHIPSLLNINVPHPNEIRALPDDPGEQSSSSNLMDAAKRKGLPAWIREGLEKMEREKQKQQEKETNSQCDLSDDGTPISSRKATVISLNLKQLDNDHDESTEIELLVGESYGNRVEESTVIDDLSDDEVAATEKNEKNYEQKLAELMVVVRHTLTELLLEVTNEEISKIANDTVKSYKLKASSVQVIHNPCGNSALSSITGKLGLAVYGDSSSDEFSDDGDDENKSKRKAFLSESGNDSEEDIKVAVRMKRRSFVKIANEIEERVSAAAAKEEEKIKYFLQKEAEASAKKCKNAEKVIGPEKREMVTNESVSAQLSSGCGDKIIGKIYERDSGETTETKLQIINGKRQRDRGALKERTTRFSDNRDNRYLAIAATAPCVTDSQSKGNISSVPQTVKSHSQTAYNINCILPSYTYPGIGNTQKETESEVEAISKHKTSSSSENREEYKYAKRKKQQEDDSKVSPVRSLSRSSSSSSSSSSSTSTESSTSESSDNSKYSHRSVSKRSSHISSKRSRSQRDKCDDKKYYSSYDRERSNTSYSRYGRDRSRSRHRRHGSSDSDDTYSRRKCDSRYSSSSHSRSHNYSRNHRDFSRSNSRSSYSSSGKRRH